jgi:outer membrane protein insertion porin family
MRLVLALLLAWPAVSAAPQHSKAKPRVAAPTQTSWPIESLEIEGLRDYSRDHVLRVLGLKLRQVASPKDLQAAQERLNATGAFSSVAFRYGPAANRKGYSVTFEVVEAEPKFPVQFEDLGVPAQDLQAALDHSDPFYGPTIPATVPLLARYSKTIEEALAAHGKPQKVVGKLEPDEKGRMIVFFRPVTGLPTIARVRFTGNSVVPSYMLENAMNTVAVGMRYSEPRFRQVLDLQLRPIYEAHGHVRVSFPALQTEPEKDVKGLVVTVKVDEGASYTLGAVQVTGTTLPPEELHKLIKLKAGSPFNIDTIQALRAAVEQRMKRVGHMHVTSRIDRQIDDQAKKVNVTLRVEPGPRYTFGTLTIEGLDILTEPAIRKMWSMKEGQPYNAEYPQHFLDGVREDGVLDNLGETRAVPRQNDELHTVDVTLYFKGAPPKPKTPGYPPG